MEQLIIKMTKKIVDITIYKGRGNISLNNINILVVMPLHEKPYFASLGTSWKAQKDQGNIILSSIFWLKKTPYFPSPKSSKQKLFSN